MGYLKEMISINIYTKLIDKILNAQEWLENKTGGQEKKNQQE